MEERKRRRSPRAEPGAEPREAALEPRREAAASREAAGAKRARAGEVSLSPEGETSTATLDPQERPMLEVDSLVKIYGSRTVVDGVSFTVRSGEIIGLLGKNGAGKTTTFRMTIGMIQADEGAIRFFGRDSVCINSGGEKIFAEEVERALKHHPAVYDVVVTGTPNERWGEQVTAVVALRPGMSPTDDELRATAAEHIARYKLPKAFVFVDSILRSASGKPDYRWAKATATDRL